MLQVEVIPTDTTLINLIGSLNNINDNNGFQKTEKAFDAVTSAIKRAWQKSVGPKHKISQRKESKFSRYIFSTDPVVGWLENGLSSYDMRKTHTKGKKSRVIKARMGKNGKVKTSWWKKNKDGSRELVRAGSSYTIIPFRHGTEKGSRFGDAQPGQVGLNQIMNKLRSQEFQESEVVDSPETSGTASKNYWGDMIKRAEYKWGNRLELPDRPEFDNLQGLVKMKGGTYLTFRVISQNSPDGSWMHPGIKSRKYLSRILSQNAEKISNIMDTALRGDIGL